MKKVAKKTIKKYQKGDTVTGTGNTVTKDRKDTKGIAEERAKGNTVYIPKPKPSTPKMKKGGTIKKKK